MTNRSYHQYCGLASALDVLGDRWTMLVVRDLLTGPKRFKELMERAHGMGPNLLSSRLDGLVDAGVVETASVPGDRRGVSYRLSVKGEELRGPILSLARWGLQHTPVAPGDEPGAVVSADWARLAVEALATAPGRRPVVAESFGFRIDAEEFTLVATRRGCRVESGVAPGTTAVMVTDSRTFMQIGSRAVNPLEAIGRGKVVVEGSLDAVARCAGLLGLVPVDQVGDAATSA